MIEGSAEDVTQNLFSQQGAAQQQDHPPAPSLQEGRALRGR